MAISNRDKIIRLLKSIETGESSPVAVVDEEKYIQHNPQTEEGSVGLAELFKRLSKTSPRVNIVRAFEDGDFVFAHTEYDFSKRNIGFEVFRFEDGRAVEHWDNIQRRLGPNQSGRTMVDGVTEARDHSLTESNRSLVGSFVQAVLVGGQVDKFDEFVDEANFIEHNPRMGDNLDILRSDLKLCNDGTRIVNYRQIHRILAEGDFVLSVCEGYFHHIHTAFYDLFRVTGGKIVEHWDTIENIAPKAAWKNDNGKF